MPLARESKYLTVVKLKYCNGGGDDMDIPIGMEIETIGGTLVIDFIEPEYDPSMDIITAKIKISKLAVDEINKNVTKFIYGEVMI